MTAYTYTDEVSPAGTALTAASTGFGTVSPGSGGSIVSDSTHVKVGTFAAKFSPAASVACSCAQAVSGSSVAVRMPVYLTALPTSDTYMIQLFNGATRLASVHINSAGKTRLDNAAGTTGVATDPNTIPLTSFVYMNLYAVAGTTTTNGSLRATLDDGAGTTIWDSGLLTGQNVGTVGSITTVNIGKSAAQAYATPFWIDFSDTKINDAASGLIPPTSSNVAPVPVITGATPSTGVQNTAVNLRGTATDSDGTVASTAWSMTSFPSTVTSPAISNASSLTTASFTPVAPGTYVVRLTATDNLGAVAYVEKTITVSAVVAGSGSGGNRYVYTSTGWR